MQSALDAAVPATSVATIDVEGRPRQTAEAPKRKPRKSRVLDPAGELYHHWSLVVSLAFLYNFWALSYRFAFQEIDQSTMALWFTLDYSADLIYLLDILINCRTGFLEEGVLIRNKNKTRHHYQECTRFYLDCLCLLPLDILYLTWGFNSIVRCLRLVKIYKFWNFMDRTERHTNYPNVFRTFTLVHYILVIFHWNACLFHMISTKNILDIQNLYNISNTSCDGIYCQYLHAFYWSTLALTTVGDLPRPRTKAEYIYVIVELFFGLFLVATVLGHVANIVTNVSAARREFQARLDGVKTFMRMRRVSEKLQDKVIRWFDYLWITQKSSDEERSVACLPDRLKAEIAIHVHLDTLRRVDIFQNTEAGFLCELVLRLKLVLFSPGDYVCRKNEVGHEMYIVSRGYLEVLTDNDSSVVATLRAGSYFGEISVLNVGLAGNKRTASVRSVGYSDLFCLNKQDLWDVLKNYPNAELRIRARAEERLNKLDIGQQQQQQFLQQQQLQQQQQQQHQQQQQQVKSTHSLKAAGGQRRLRQLPGAGGGASRGGEGASTGGCHRHCHLARPKCASWRIKRPHHRVHEGCSRPIESSRSLTDANELLDISSHSSTASSSIGPLISEPPESLARLSTRERPWAGETHGDEAGAYLGHLSSGSMSGAASTGNHHHRHRHPHSHGKCWRGNRDGAGHEPHQSCHSQQQKRPHHHDGACEQTVGTALSASATTSWPSAHLYQPPVVAAKPVYWVAGASAGGAPLLHVPLVAAPMDRYQLVPSPVASQTGLVAGGSQQQLPLRMARLSAPGSTGGGGGGGGGGASDSTSVETAGAASPAAEVSGATGDPAKAASVAAT